MNFDFFSIILILFASLSGAGIVYIGILYVNRFIQIASTRKLLLVDDEANIIEDAKGEKKGTLLDKFDIPEKLAWAGLHLTPAVGLSVVGVNGILFGTLFYLFTEHFMGFIIGLGFSLFFIKMLVEMKIAKRRSEFNAAMAKAMSILVRMMRQGIGFEQAMQKGVEVSNSILFKNLMRQYLLEKDNIGEYDAFENLKKHIQSDQLKIFAISVAIGRESGGSFASTLEKLENTIHDKQKLQEKVDVTTREASFGAYIILGLVGLLYNIFNETFNNSMNDFYFNSPEGKLYFLAVCSWIVIGLIVNKKLTKIA